ncbi:MAG: outer membrane beta-barrel protein [Desulfobacteraceae bacterium]|nr:outer membrane beta-barrel protein [Desulfobacteraceae bacterium]MBC2754255.1 outer membrane beta-barrel protein [Desulfobacteraceae bacterium]
MKYYIYHVIKYAIGIVLLIGSPYTSAVAAVSFYPYISVGNTFTDNLNLTAENEEYDFITTLSPGIDVSMTGQFSALSLSYIPTYASYLRFPENNTLRHNAVLDTSRQITRTTRVEFSDYYLYTEDPISDIDTTVRRGREPYEENTAAFSVSNQFGPEDSIELGYEYFFLNNRSPIIEDREYHRPGITMNYWPVPNRYASELEISYTRSTFDVSQDYDDVYGRLRLTRLFGPHLEVYAEYTHELTDYVAEGEDYQVYSPLVGFIWDEYINYNFLASFGYFFRKNDHGKVDSGPVGTIETHYTLDQGTSVSISGNAGYDRASYGAENLGFNPYYGVTGSVDYPLGRRLNSNIFAGYRWNIYPDEEPDRDDAVWRTGAGLTYQALPWMIVEVNYIFRKLDSNIDLNDYVENRAEIIVTLNPRQPVMLTR